MTASVLVVEDERKIRELLRSYLEHDGLTVITTGSGAEAIQLARDTAPDLIVLDLRLPDVAGEEVAREVRAATQTPIMMLTAKTDTTDRIRGLELGADDYVTKPFSPREVVLRARAILRRAGTVPGQDAPACYGGGQLVIDEARRQVTAGGHPATLTSTEWKLLTTLASVPGRVYSRYELVNPTRGYEYDGYERTIDSRIRNLRRKIETDPHAPQLIETVTGAGHRLAVTRDHQTTAAPAARLPARSSITRPQASRNTGCSSSVLGTIAATGSHIRPSSTAAAQAERLAQAGLDDPATGSPGHAGARLPVIDAV